MGTLFSRSSESAQDTLSSLNHENTNQYDFSSPLTLQPHHIVEEYSPRFDLENPLWLEYLQDNGYVIIKDIAMRNEIVEALKLLWEFLEEKCQMYEGNPETWTDENFAKLGDSRTGILSFSGIQHSKFLWYLRLLPKVRQIFEQIYKTDDLLTSFDGGNIFRPWHNLKLAEKEHLKTSTGWFHVDQGKTLIGFHCIQGLVSLTDCNQYTGGFCVVPGSHLHHEKFVFDAAKKSNQNFVMIPHDSPYLISPYRQVLPVCSAGDVILWDSRTIHCNCPSLVTSIPPEVPTDRLLRVVGYVCMTPTEYAARALKISNCYDIKDLDELLDARQRLYERGIGTSHWPHLLSSFISKNTSIPKHKDLFDEEIVRRCMVIGKERGAVTITCEKEAELH